MDEQHIRYTLKTAQASDLYIHMGICSDLFIPPLAQLVDIEAYAAKVYNHAITFEAWSDNRLVGLIAAYFNDEVNRISFVTYVSTLPEFGGRGIGSSLMAQCIEYANNQHYNKISLEVNRQNEAAIILYKRYRFEEMAKNGDFIKMVLSLNDK